MEWLKDKVRWLKTFNNPPRVEINATKIVSDDSNKPVVNINGRVNLVVDCGKIVYNDNKNHHIFDHGDAIYVSK